jgi:hypothetical protein
MTVRDSTFTVLTTLSDPFTADGLVVALEAADIEAFTRPLGAASTDLFGAASPRAWALLVPTDLATKASAIVERTIEEFESDAEANAQAAEQEATEVPAAG